MTGTWECWGKLARGENRICTAVVMQIIFQSRRPLVDEYLRVMLLSPYKHFPPCSKSRLNISPLPIYSSIIFISISNLLLHKHCIPRPCLPCRVNFREQAFHISINPIAPPLIPLLIRKLNIISKFHLQPRNTHQRNN